MKFNGKYFNPEAWAAYMDAVPNPRLNKLMESRAVIGDKRLRDLFKDKTQTGTVYAMIPYFGLLGGDSQNYDGEGTLTTESTTSYTQGVFTYGRMKAWTEADFSYDVTGGADFTDNIRRQITEFWNTDDQNVILAILKGIFSMTGSSLGGANQKFVENHTHDISKTVSDKTDETTLVDTTTLNTAIQKACGDNKGKFSLVLMHSAVATNLENLKLLKNLTYTDEKGVERDLALYTWNGRLVIVDDSMPAEAKTGANNYMQYTTYVLGNGAISFEKVGAKVPYEMARDAFTKGGQDSLITRIRNAVAVAGISYLKKHQATNSPTNAELAKGGNWALINDGDKAIDDKAIPIARIISRG